MGVLASIIAAEAGGAFFARVLLVVFGMASAGGDAELVGAKYTLAGALPGGAAKLVGARRQFSHGIRTKCGEVSSLSVGLGLGESTSISVLAGLAAAAKLVGAKRTLAGAGGTAKLFGMAKRTLAGGCGGGSSVGQKSISSVDPWRM